MNSISLNLDKCLYHVNSNIFLSHECVMDFLDTKNGMAISKMMTLKMWQKQIDSWDGLF
jgi:hypothetical protein